MKFHRLYIIKTCSKEKMYEIIDIICKQLDGHEDYINNHVIVKDSSENIIRVICKSEREHKLPTIEIPTKGIVIMTRYMCSSASLIYDDCEANNHISHVYIREEIGVNSK